MKRESELLKTRYGDLSLIVDKSDHNKILGAVVEKEKFKREYGLLETHYDDAFLIIDKMDCDKVVGAAVGKESFKRFYYPNMIVSIVKDEYGFIDSFIKNTGIGIIKDVSRNVIGRFFTVSTVNNEHGICRARNLESAGPLLTLEEIFTLLAAKDDFEQFKKEREPASQI